jgi:hypothetical protein
MFELKASASDLTAPALLVAFDGWVNAGAVGTATADHIADGGETVAIFDSDALYDYRANRPGIDFVDGIMAELRMPEMALLRHHVDGRDLLILSGPEPNWNWQRLSRAVADLATELGVVEHISMGGVPSAVPHTRPTRLLVTASRPDLISGEEQFPEGLLRVPGAAVSVVESYLVDQGTPAVGFWAQVPHYVAETYLPGVVAMVERVSRHLGVRIALGSLVDDSAMQQERLSDLVAGQEQAAEYVRSLENLLASQGEVPTGEEIADEIQRFLEEEGGLGGEG